MSGLHLNTAVNEAAEPFIDEGANRDLTAEPVSLLDGPSEPMTTGDWSRIEELIRQDEALQATEQRPASNSGQLTEIDEPTWDLLREALRFMVSHVGNNDTWSDCGYSLLSLKRSRPARELWIQFSRKAAGYDPEKPDDPEKWWDAHERATPRADYRHILKMARKRGWRGGSTSRPEVFAPVTSDPGTPLVITPPALPSLVFQRLPEAWQLVAPPPRRWIVDGYLSAETATLLISLGGLGKSYLTLYLAICIALGIDFCGRKCRQGRVVIVSAEDDFSEILRRLIALAQHLSLPLQPGVVDQVRDRIEVIDMKQWRRLQGASPVLTKSDRGGAALTPLVGHLARSIGKTDLVVFDTVSRFNGAEENSNDAAARLIDAFEIIAEETGAAVLALAHTGIKGRTEDVNQYSSRGASAFSDNARSVLVLAPLSGDLINKITDPGQYAKATRNDLLRLCHTKSNYAKRADDVYFDRQAQGVLVPVQLKLHVPATEGQLVERLIEQVETGQVTRNTVRTKFADWFGPTVTREQAFSAFDKAVHEGRLVLSSERNNAKSYRANPSAAANEDLISGRCVS